MYQHLDAKKGKRDKNFKLSHTFSIDVISPTLRSSLVISTGRLVAEAPPSFLVSDSIVNVHSHMTHGHMTTHSLLQDTPGPVASSTRDHC